jgi:uncharacterized protein YdhG (YjbR/CyaY superfamily)
MKRFATVTEYLRAVPAKPRAALQRLRKTIKAAAPGSVEGISYGMPTFKLQGRMLVSYAAFKNHLSFFPGSTAVRAAEQGKLMGYKTSKGTIQFTVDQPLPATLVKRLIKARIRENEVRSAKRG